jgi:hypothetical protein
MGNSDRPAGYNPAIQQIENLRYFQLRTSQRTSAKSGLFAAEIRIWFWLRQVRLSVFPQFSIFEFFSPPAKIVFFPRWLSLESSHGCYYPNPATATVRQ